MLSLVPVPAVAISELPFRAPVLWSEILALWVVGVWERNNRNNFPLL